jgi:tRNA dimethylallyltransferase
MVAKINPLIVIVGETASGKTALAIELAQKFDGEIICADSRTIYRGIDVGTAKPTKKEQSIVPHHLLDIRNLDEKYNVAEFQQDAQKFIKEISNRGKLSIMVGGSGLYIDSVIYNYTFPKDVKRNKTNPRHSANAYEPKELRLNTLLIGLQRSKEDIDTRIQQRTKTMLDNGLIDEARRLIKKYGTNNDVLKGSGYYAFIDYQNGTQSLDDSVQRFVRTSTLLAKKQRTWFKRNKSIQWVTNPSTAVDITTTFLNNY